MDRKTRLMTSQIGSKFMDIVNLTNEALRILQLYLIESEWWMRITAEQLAILAGVLQLCGYVIYIRKTLRHELEPNPSTWLMFAYGTALLTVLELDLGGGLVLLLLPATCALLSIVVAYLCWLRGRIRWPEPLLDKLAFVFDLLLTAGYIAAWWLLWRGSITEDMRDIVTLMFLVCSNATTVTAFLPLLRESYSYPVYEKSSAWLVWTFAYASLGAATVVTAGWLSPLMIYPVSCGILHFMVAVLVRPSRRARLFVNDPAV